MKYLVALLAIGCVASQHDPRYDGDAVTPEVQPAETVVRIQIVNARTHDALDPSFYIKGFGTHNLGVVKGFGGKLDRVIPKDWLGPNNCVVVVAHYPGGPDLVYEEACWRSGEHLDVRLDDIWVPGASWSHR